MSHARPELPAAIQHAREPRYRYETIVCYIKPRGGAVDIAADAREKHYVGILCGLERGPIENAYRYGWQALDRSAALETLAQRIRTELAYGFRMMADDAALELADRFLALFDADARFVTTMPDQRIARVPANFDAGLVAVDTRQLGLLWFESTSPGR